MRTQGVYSYQEYHPGYGAGDGDTERYEYLCPCGNGRVIEEHDNEQEVSTENQEAV